MTTAEQTPENEPSAAAVGSPLDRPVRPQLVCCPLCGVAERGYTLDEGSTFRWWKVVCKNCGESLTECRSNQSTKFGAPMPDHWPAADVAWNEAGGYAEGLRVALESARRALHEIAEEWAGAECGEPVHAQEAYAIGLSKRMYGIAASALRPNVGVEPHSAAGKDCDDERK